MARFYGAESHYLKKQIRYYFWSGMTVGVVLIIAGIIGIYLNKFFGNSIVGSLILSAALLGIILVSINTARAYDLLIGKYDSGLRGEYLVAKTLQKLPHTFSVFQDITIGNYGNIDFAVVGPTGIFAIEVKSHHGKIGFDGAHLTRDGRPLEKDFFTQVENESFAIHNFLNEQTGNDIFVKPIIAFSSQRAYVHLGNKAVRGHVRVVNKFLLNSLLETDPNYYYQQGARQKIEAALVSKLSSRQSVLATRQNLPAAVK